MAWIQGRVNGPEYRFQLEEQGSAHSARTPAKPPRVTTPEVDLCVRMCVNKGIVTGWYKALLAIALLLSVLFVFISPVSDLDPSAMRAAQAALALALAIAAYAFLISCRIDSNYLSGRLYSRPSLPRAALLSLLCFFIC